MMTLHKLSAGDGYTYLTRQVAAADSTERGYTCLGAYYAAKGESPGVWAGSGLAALGTGGVVTEEQMRSLFGLGRHPDADKIAARLRTHGASPAAAAAAGRLGRAFPIFENSSAWRQRLTQAYQDWNARRGLPAGTAVPAADRERLRTDLAVTMFAEEHHRAPATTAELSGFLARQSRPDGTAVAGFDLTFTPVKSVSALWAVAPPDLAGRIEAAHHAAVEKTMAFLEREAAYTRVGARGPAQVDTNGLITARFVHRDSRNGDPNLHTHVAVSAKVQTHDGRWLALDARMIYRLNVTASEFYNTTIEAELHTRAGLEFADDGRARPGQRPVREIVGVDPRLLDRWSSRREQIIQTRENLAEQFLARHGRVPTTVEMIALAQQANLATRQAKHDPRSHADQRALWHQQAVETLGSQAAIDDMTARATTPTSGRGRGRRAGRRHFRLLTDLVVDQLTDTTLRVVSDGRANWRESNLAAEALRQVRGARLDPADLTVAAARVTAAALRASVPIGDHPTPDPALPEQLRRADGTSIYTVAKDQLFTSRDILDAETRILAAAARRGARTIDPRHIDTAARQWSADHDGRALNHAQQALVAAVATTDQALMLALAPAGTGKTTAMAVLAAAWKQSGGTVLGLAPQASAAQELAAVLPDVDADTVDKLVYDLHHTPDRHWQPWMTSIGPDSLVIVDEAGLAGTRNLDQAIAFVTGRGGRVLLVGDDRQRAANSAGGVLADLHAAHGAVSLDEVLRFTDPAEGHVTLAMRNGDTSVVGYLADHRRVHAVTPDTAAAHTFHAWAADLAAGIDTVMIAPTLAMVTDLNARARAHRLAHTRIPVGAEIELPNGETVSAGDTIITKRNQRSLTLGAVPDRPDFVRNNYRWTVDEVHPDGSITATETRRGRTRRLPAWYVREGHVRLGYAHTHASIQGLTVGKAGQRRGTAHVVVTPDLTRNDLYPAATRATDGTHLYVVLGGDGDPHDIVQPDAIHPPTAVEILTQIIGRDGSPRSATTTHADADRADLRLGHAADAYAHAVLTAAEHLVGSDTLAEIDRESEDIVPGVLDAPAWETLRGHLAAIAAADGDPIERLRTAVEERELGTAVDLAAVLDYRLDPTGNHSLGEGPLPWLPAVPATVDGLPDWPDYLTAAATGVTDLASAVRTDTTTWTPDTAPAWALPYLPDPALLQDLAVWRAAESVPPEDLRPAGDTPRRIALRHRYRDLVDRAIACTGHPNDHTDRWADILADLTDTPHLITDDTHWPVLAGRLTLDDNTGLPVPELLRRAVREPLPAEAAAAALHWRLAPHLGTPVTGAPTAQRIRPTWTATLQATLGADRTDRLVADRLWPTIVATVDRLTRTGIDIPQLIDNGAALTANGPAPDHELAATLLATLTLLADPDPADPTAEPLHPDPVDDDLVPAPDAYDGPFPNEPDLAADTDLPGDPVDHIDVPTSPEPDSPEPEPEPGQAEPDQEAAAIARIHRALTDAAEFFADRANGSWVPQHMFDRGLLPSTAGYAPAGWTTTIDHLRTLGHTDLTLLAAGLARHSRRGTLIDHFRDRATVPITTPDGQTVGFTGRKPPTDQNPENPKYLNSPTTAVFDKSRHVYGLTPATAQQLRDGAELVITEGPFDAAAITTARPDIVAVAPLGTALTAGQLHTIDQVAALADRTVTAIFDADAAGLAAAVRAHPLLQAAGVDLPLTIDDLGNCKDPSELLATAGPDTLQAALNTRIPLVDHVVHDVIDHHPVDDGTAESRVDALKAVRRLIAGQPWTVKLRECRIAAMRTHIPTEAVLEAVLEVAPSDPHEERPAASGPGGARPIRRPSAQPAQATAHPERPPTTAPARPIEQELDALIDMWPTNIDLVLQVAQNEDAMNMIREYLRDRNADAHPFISEHQTGAFEIPDLSPQSSAQPSDFNPSTIHEPKDFDHYNPPNLHSLHPLEMPGLAGAQPEV